MQQAIEAKLLFSRIFDEFVSGRGSNASRLQVHNAWVRLAKYLGVEGVGGAIENLVIGGPDDASNIAAGLRSQLCADGLSPSSVNGTLSGIRSFMYHLFKTKRIHWVLEVANITFEFRAKDYGLSDGFEFAIDDVLPASDDPIVIRDRAILSLLGHEGLKRGQVTNLMPADVVDDGRRLRIAVRRGSGKTEIPTSIKTQQTLDAWIRIRDHRAIKLFHGLTPGKASQQLTGASIHLLVQRRFNSARFSPNALRNHAIRSQLGGDIQNSKVRRQKADEMLLSTDRQLRCDYYRGGA